MNPVANPENIHQLLKQKGCKVVAINNKKISYVCRCYRRLWDTLSNVKSENWNGCPNCSKARQQYAHTCRNCSDKFYSYSPVTTVDSTSLCSTCRRYPHATVFPLFSVFTPLPMERANMEVRRSNGINTRKKEAMSSFKKIQYSEW